MSVATFDGFPTFSSSNAQNPCAIPIIPVLQSPVLARALHAHGELDQPIPSTLFNAVAQVLAYVWRLKAAMRGEAAMPGELPVPTVPPELDPHDPAALAAKASKDTKVEGVN